MNRRRALAYFVLIVLLAIVGVKLHRQLNDFPVYHLAGNSLLRGRTDLYAPDFAGGAVMDYRYPPIFLLLFFPIWLLPYFTAGYVWYAFSVAQIFLCGAAVRRVVRASTQVFTDKFKEGELSRNARRAMWIVAVLICGQYYVKNLKAGNAHLLITCLSFAGFALIVLRRRETLAALLVALAISIKITPVLFLPYFVLKRRWKFVALTCAFLIVLNLLPAIYFGWRENNNLIVAWARHVLVDNTEFHELQGPINQSLKGQLRRYLSEIDYTERLTDKNYLTINPVALDVRTVDVIWKTTAGGLYLGSLLFIWWSKGKAKPGEGVLGEKFLTDSQVSDAARRADNRHALITLSGRRREFLEIGLMTCVILLVSPSTAKIYFVALLWSVIALGLYAFGGESKAQRRCRVALWVTAGINFALPLIPGGQAARLFLVIGTDFYITLLLLAASMYALQQGEKDSSLRQVSE